MLIIFFAIAAWLAVLVLVTAMGIAASRGDEALGEAMAQDRRELSSGIVLLEWSGAPLVSAGTASVSRGRAAAAGRA